ncbi:MAG: 5'-nucleotidase C-terminal domain-containing protein [Clostridiales bacterium]|nr:5'-nucleotidase C-terminal domain-containing protein [Clostridiales bacterium]
MRKKLLTALLSATMLMTVACTAAGPAEESTVPASEPAASESAAEPETKGKGAKIAVFETSDTHGYIADTSSMDEASFEYRLAYIAQVVNDARSSGDYDDVLLLDGGDIYQGAPISNLTDGAVMRAALDIMGYDAVALGNHEFDWGVEEYATDADGTLPAYKVGSFEGDPDIPVLCADLYYADNDERTSFTQDYVIVEKAGYRICLIGYAPDYSGTIMVSKISPYVIKADLDAFVERVREINELEQPDVTIVMAHETPEYIADAFTTDEVQLVTGGHKHMGIYGVASSGVPYIQGDCQAQGYSSAVIVIDEDGNVTVEDQNYTCITEEPELLYDTPENADLLDDDVLAVTKAGWDEISGGLSEVLGYIDTSVEKKGYIDGVSTTGGNFVTSLMVKAMEEDGVIIAFYNRGGYRYDMIVPDGETREVTVGDIYALNPFNNTWLVYDLSGSELAQQLENALATSNYGDQVTGLTYEYNKYGTEEEPEFEIVSITLDDGTPVDIEGTEEIYRVVTSNYSATLEGSVFEDKIPVFPETEAPIDNIALIEVLREMRDEEGSDGYIPVDTGANGVCLNADEWEEAA